MEEKIDVTADHLWQAHRLGNTGVGCSHFYNQPIFSLGMNSMKTRQQKENK